MCVREGRTLPGRTTRVCGACVHAHVYVGSHAHTRAQKGSSGADKKVAVTFPICHAPAHSIFFPAASYMVE